MHGFLSLSTCFQAWKWLSLPYENIDMNIPGGARKSLNIEMSLGAESSCLIHLFAGVVRVCVVQGRFNEYFKSDTIYESSYSHTLKYLYTFSMSLLLNQRLEMNIIHWWQKIPASKKTYVSIILLESSKD